MALWRHVLALSFTCSGRILSLSLQIKGFAKVQKDVVTLLLLEPGPGGHCMTLVTRYLLVDRGEREVNSVLTLSLFGSDRQSGLYNVIEACTFESAKT